MYWICPFRSWPTTFVGVSQKKLCIMHISLTPYKKKHMAVNDGRFEKSWIHPRMVLPKGFQRTKSAPEFQIHLPPSPKLRNLQMPCSRRKHHEHVKSACLTAAIILVVYSNVSPSKGTKFRNPEVHEAKPKSVRRATQYIFLLKSNMSPKIASSQPFGMVFYF